MTIVEAPATDSPFHAGEHRVQERLGVRAIEEWARQVVRPFLPEQHREFHTSLPFLVAAGRDARDRPWATLLTGRRGFATSPDPRSLVLAAEPGPGDALAGAFAAGSDIGLLGIELATRRRNRVNGRVATRRPGHIAVAVAQTFGNCPQYIHERAWRWTDDVPAQPSARGRALSAAQRAWITSADTFFIATGHRGAGEHPSFGMDASHRGGDPGFVSVDGDTRLAIPDYPGNNHYNTIGNLELDPRAGLLFVSFATGSLLQLTGRVTIDWHPDAARHAERVLHFDVDEIVEQPMVLPLRWETDAGEVRRLRVAEKIRESDDVASFVLVASDGRPLPPFEPGQYLPLSLDVPGAAEPLRRTYSLSGAPSTERYRITVKREAQGTVSRFLHDAVDVDAILRAGAPAGDFVVGCRQCPVVLVSAGIGLTPFVSMLHALLAEESARPVWFVHGTRDGRHHPLAAEVRALAARRPGITVHVAYSRPRAEDSGHDSVGRIDGALLDRLVSAPDAHYFLCGPVAFMGALHSELDRRGVGADRIHSETFGPRPASTGERSTAVSR